MNDEDPQATVLMISGWGRCGSTVLDMMLGQVRGVVSAGEVRELWLRGCVEDRPCGCGEAFSVCAFWQAVGERAFGGWDRLDLDLMLDVRRQLDRPWALPALLAGRMPARMDAEAARYGQALSRLFSAVSAVSGSDVVVDSSKIPTHVLLAHRYSRASVRVLHLVRDSRGVAYSVGKRVEKPRPGGPPTLLPQHGPAAAGARYDLYNGASGLLARVGLPYLRLRYEDLMDEPRARLLEVLEFADAPVDELPFLEGPEVTLAPNHLVDGNPVRFTRESLTLRTDDAWRSELAPGPRRAVTGLTWPLLRRYGYVGRSGRSRFG